MDTKLKENEVEFLHSLTEDQVQNWMGLIAYMKGRGNCNYDHSGFSSQNANGYCALSYAIRADIVPLISNELDIYMNMCDKKFGENSFEYFFSALENIGENFIIFRLASERNIDLEACKAKEAAEVLDAFIKMRDVKDYKKITLYWYDGNIDNFASKDDVKSFLELNPHRTNQVKKLTGTMLIPRTVYDEIIEEITL